MTDPIERIEAALTRLGAEHEPPAGWEARVFAKIAQERHAEPAPRRPRWWMFAIPAVSVSVAVVAAIVVCWPRPDGFTLAVTFDRHSEVVRSGGAPNAGDVAHATVTGGGPHRAVWIYRDDVLVTACPGGDRTQCESSGEETTATVRLTMGKYQMVALTSSVPIAPPAGELDSDLARAQDAGATLDRKPVMVR